MELTLDLPSEAQERLRRKAQLSGISAEEAARQAAQIAKEPEFNPMLLVGFFLLMFLFSQPVPAELKQELNDAVREFICSLLKNGNEEQLAALLPKMPDADAPTEETTHPVENSLSPSNQALIALLQQWRDEDAAMSPEEAAQADADLLAFKAGMNANREATGERILFP